VDILLDNKPLASAPTDAGGRYGHAFSVAAAALQQRMLVTEGYHLLTVVPKANGYERGAGASVSFAVQENMAGRVLQQIEVTQVSGKPDLTAPVAPDTPMLSKPVLQSGSLLTQGYTVTTRAGDQVTLKMPFENGAHVEITISESTALRIAQFHKDAAGKVKLRVHLSNPGQLNVSVTNPGPTPLDYEIITPTAGIKTVKTRYQVRVDVQGNTTVAATEGEVLLTPANATLAPVTVRAGNYAEVSVEKVSQRRAIGMPVGDPEIEEPVDDKGGLTIGENTLGGPTIAYQPRADAQALYDKGSEYYEEQKWAKAEAEYRKALKLDPKFDECWNMLGNALFKQSKWAEAEKAFREASRLNPNESYYHAQLAGALLKLGRRDEAMAAAKKGVALGLEDHEVFDELGLTTKQ
jgi:tetratricopeptide (TPR) repeat protein